MNIPGPTAAGPLTLVLLACLLAAAPAGAQSTSGAPSTAPPASAAPLAPGTELLAQLVTEVRQLRLDLEQTALINLRVMVTLQRMTIQEQQVRQLSDEVRELETSAAASANEQERLRGEVAQFEEKVQQEGDPAARRVLAEQLGSLRENLEREPHQEQEFRRRAFDASRSLAVETGKLEQLGRALDALERTLETLTRRAGQDRPREPHGP